MSPFRAHNTPGPKVRCRTRTPGTSASPMAARASRSGPISIGSGRFAGLGRGSRGVGKSSSANKEDSPSFRKRTMESSFFARVIPT